MDATLHPRFPAQETLQLVCNLKGIKASRRMVLTFLVLRTNRITGCTFVSNAAIALGCGMSLSAVVECLYDLEKVHKVITRTVRNGRSRTTKNTEVLVHRLREMQHTKEELRTLMRSMARVKSGLPRKHTGVTSLAGGAEAAIAVALSTPPPTKTSIKSCTSDRTMNLLLMQPFHPDFLALAPNDIKRILESCIRSCIQVTGTEQRCFETLRLILSSPDHYSRKARLMKAKKPGGYIAKSIEDWVGYYDGLIEEFEEQIPLLREGQTVVVPLASSHRLDRLEEWLAACPEFAFTPCIRKVDDGLAILQMCENSGDALV